MSEVFIVDAVRTPLGKRGGGLAGMHPADLEVASLSALVERSGIDPNVVDQVIGGCVSQVGEQSFNTARTGWLAAGLPFQVPSTSIDSQCGSSQQATTLAAGLLGAGMEDIAITVGVESMSRIPLGANMKPGSPLPPSYFAHYEMKSQFQGAERIAANWGITREDTDAFGLRSQQLAAQAWSEGRFDREVAPVEAPVLGEDGQPSGKTAMVSSDEGLRATSLEKLGTLKVIEEGGVHTAGSSSQITDGSAAVLLANEAGLKRLGLEPRARIVYSTIVGSDPEYVLTGPIPATEKVLRKTGLSIDDIDRFEVNEAFASVVLAWQKESGADMDRVNVNGGAIALGHPTGATGDRLITTALHELERSGGRRALITMCCGGGLGTGTVIERV
jgi:acetyl-CoA C-acetyltransferase